MKSLSSSTELDESENLVGLINAGLN